MATPPGEPSPAAGTAAFEPRWRFFWAGLATGIALASLAVFLTPATFQPDAAASATAAEAPDPGASASPGAGAGRDAGPDAGPEGDPDVSHPE
jgi:hypothetical protein